MAIDYVEEQAHCDFAIGGFFFYAAARCQNHGAFNIVGFDVVVEGAIYLVEQGLGIYLVIANGKYFGANAVGIKGFALAVGCLHVQFGRVGVLGFFSAAEYAGFFVVFSIDDVAPRDRKVACAHQLDFDFILNAFDIHAVIRLVQFSFNFRNNSVGEFRHVGFNFGRQ